MTTAAAPTNAKGVRPFRVDTDPVVPDHAGCLVCDGPRSRVAVRHGDPFCTTVCCRSWYAVADPPPRSALNA